MSTNRYDEEQKLWSVDYSPLVFDTRISMGHAILWSLAKNPHKIIQINHETNIQLTSRFIRRQTIRAALNLRELGYEKGDIFVIIARNSHYVTPIIYASLCMGCPINPLDTSFSKPEIMHMLSITKPKLVFCDVDLYDLVRECLNELENETTIFTFSGQNNESIPVETLFEERPEEDTFVAAELDGENTTAVIVCTSGSTGLSKGVCLSHAILMHQMCEIPVREDDVVLTFSSAYWISGIILLIGSAIKGFRRVITTDRFSCELMLNMIEEHRVTFFLSASHALELALKCEQFYETNLSSIRLILCGGSKLSPSTAVKIAKYLKNGIVMQAYGMSELGGIATIGITAEENDASVGRLSFGTEAKIIDEDGNRLGVGETGEICLKTKFKFLGYFDNEDATNGAIDDEGFLLTGDIGYFDEEQKLCLVDRKKDMMKYCASQISPTEIEQLIIQCVSVKAVCVVGIPDDVVGDLPAAVIVRNDNEPIVTQQEIEQMVADHFADYKRLRGGVYFIQTKLPLTASGKVLRRCVKEMAIEMYNDATMEPDS